MRHLEPSFSDLQHDVEQVNSHLCASDSPPTSSEVRGEGEWNTKTYLEGVPE